MSNERTAEFTETLREFRAEAVWLRKQKAGTKNAAEGVNAEPLVSWAMRLVGFVAETLGTAESEAMTRRIWPRAHPHVTRGIAYIDGLIAKADELYVRPR